jgi:hypothetical protein
LPDLDNSVSGEITSVFELHPNKTKANITNPNIFDVSHNILSLICYKKAMLNVSIALLN